MTIICRVVVSFGQIVDELWLSHTPARFGPSLKTRDPRVVSQ